MSVDAQVVEAARAALAARSDAAAVAARRRLVEGTYGDCTRCGEAVAPEVLRERPAWALCADCSEALAQARAGQRLGVCGVKPR